jgi:hypothetical protein
MKGLLLDETGDLQIRNGSLVVGEVDGQIIEHVLIAAKGEFKEAPLIGANVRMMLAGTPDPFWRNNAKEMLKLQHIKVKRLEVTGNEIIVEHD